MSFFSLTEISSLDLSTHRKELLETKGYTILRQFCSSDVTKHIRKFWNNSECLTREKKGYWLNRNDYAMPEIVTNDRGESHVTSQRYECFFWNTPKDECTYEVCYNAHILRNILSGFPAYYQILPFDGYSVSYRPTRSDTGCLPISKHTDRRCEEESSVITLSLALSNPTDDFMGGGMPFDTKNEGYIDLYYEKNIKAGDLIIWDHGQQHEVPTVTSSDPEDPLSGFWRILSPSHPIFSSREEFAPGIAIMEGKMPRLL
jgi:hypothetical protein